jgi:RepB DNA-primase from phage plasmid
MGANVYVAANPLRSGSRRRTKESIASVRHLYIDIDFDGEARVAALHASDAVPAPTAILSTSTSEYQVLWRVEGFDVQRQEATLKQLAFAFGGDPACTDCNRVLRVPGFLNRKYSPARPVTVECPRDSICNPGDFRLNNALTNVALQLLGVAPPMRPGNRRFRNRTGHGLSANLRARMRRSSRKRSLPAAPTNPIRCTTHNARWTWLRRAFGSSKAHPLTT